MPTYVAVDLGASGGRVIAGTVDDGRLALDVVHRFPNRAAHRGGHLRWDLGRLLAEVDAGLAKVPQATSIGVDTWAVDYGLLDDDGTLLADLVAYRDDRTDAVIDEVHALVGPEELFALNGLQHLPFTTLYQLVAEQQGPLWDDAAHVVLLPDLVVHHLTGVLGTEVTNASTTGLLDVHTRTWSTELFTRLDLPVDRFPPLDAPGSHRGTTCAGVPVTTVGSHDTASAVVAVPATSPRAAYVASGTWSLVGVELADPIVTDAARVAGFTNELGVDGRTRFLRNVGGLWLLQECLREWRTDDLAGLLTAASDLPLGGPQVDVDDPAFIPPDGMPDRIAAAARRDHQSPAEAVRCILDSLAVGYARTIDAAEALTGMPIDVVHVVGGGSQNELLCRLTATATGRPVVAGPVEATAIGNLVVQARADGALHGSLEDLRAGLAASIPLRRYEPA